MKLSDRINNMPEEALGNLILLATMICCYISGITVVILGSLNIFHIGLADSVNVRVFLIVLFILLSIVIIAAIVSKGRILSQKWLKYYLLTIMYVWFFVASTVLFFHTTLFLLFPIFISGCYNTPRVNRISIAVSIVLIILTPIVAYKIGGMSVSFLEWYLSILDPKQSFPELKQAWAEQGSIANDIGSQPAYIQLLLWVSLPRLMMFLSLLVMSILGNYVSRKAHATQLKKITDLQDSIIYSMSDVVENRDASTGGHVKRTQDSVRILIENIKDEFDKPEKYWNDVVKSASLHDLGKIAVEDAILTKPGKLTNEEYEKIKKHPVKSKIIVDQIFRNIEDSELMAVAQNIALYHHEKYDGSGYPTGLSGDSIPLEARIMALADVYDALVSERCYKQPYSFEEAYNIIKDSMGTHFDPKLWNAFDKSKEKLEDYYRNRKTEGKITN